jgi:hypothetical protein
MITKVGLWHEHLSPILSPVFHCGPRLISDYLDTVRYTMLRYGTCIDA